MPAYAVHVVIDIRPRSAADAQGISQVRRESWLAAYTGIIDRAIIDRVTANAGNAAEAPPGRHTLVAVGGDDPAVIGYAIFGPERAVAFAPSRSVTPVAGSTGELYALYVTPAWWSAGVGRALMEAVLAALREAGYASAVLWVLAENARARRFYQRAGFAADGATNVLAGLGGVLEFRYARDL